MSRHAAIAAALIAPLLGACELGGLYSPAQLEELTGISPLPEEPHWELRWYRGGDDGLLLSCELLPAEIVDEDLTGGLVYAEPPELWEAPVWVDEEEDEAYRWAVALMVLVDPSVYLPEEWVLEDGETEAVLDAGVGIWGGLGDRALLLGEGDLALLAEDVLVVEDELEALGDGGLWIGMQSQIAEVQGDLEGALYPLPEHELEDFEDEGLRVMATDFLDESAENVLTGLAIGGATTTCD